MKDKHKLEHADPCRFDRIQIGRVSGPVNINTSLENVKQVVRNAKCEHSRHMPTFDEDAARGLSADTVRQLWPRYMGQCKDCGQQVILYASWVHYISGDW